MVAPTPPAPAVSGPTARLWTALAATVCAAAAICAMHGHTREQIHRDIGWFKGAPAAGDYSSVNFYKLAGTAVQAEAFRDPGMLPIYGSSELTQPQANRPDDFFRPRPTGFDVFPVAYPGETSLVIATKLAALGPAARGRKAAVFLSPTWFQVPAVDPNGFGINFSPLHGSRVAFGGELSRELRRDFARRLLDYPELVGQFPLMKAGFGCEAQDGATDRWLLAAMAPLGALQNCLLGESDYAKTALWLRDHPLKGNGPPPHVPAVIDWDGRLREAEEFYARQPAPNTYSTTAGTAFDDKRTRAFRDPQRPDVAPDENFSRVCRASKEWTDLDLLLRTSRELDLHLLLVCQPLNANFGALQGLTPRSAELFYQKLRDAVKPYDAKLLTFPEAENDPHWYVDATHPTAKAWLAYDQALDAFQHAP